MLAVAAAVIVLAYTAFGLTGFGSTVIALPLLAAFFPLKFAVPMLMLLDLSSFLLFGARIRHRVAWREIGWLAPFALAGMAAGLTLLIGVPERHLLAVLGAFLLCYAAYNLSRRGMPARIARGWGVPAGFAGGMFSALFGTGGVIFALYNAGRLHDKEALRATNAAMIMMAALVRLVLFGAAGLLTQEGLPGTALALLAPLAAGVYLGHRLHAVVPPAAVLKAVYALLVIAGLALLARSLT